MKKLLTSGQFAELCGTTKETIRHYENIGILKPKKIGENRYKYYSILQIHEFNLISMMKNTGCSLDTIRDFINRSNEIEFREVLTNQLNQILIEKEKIIDMENTLRDSIKRFNLIDKITKLNSYYIEECDEEYFIVTEISSTATDFKWIKTINEHMKFCEKYNLKVGDKFSYIIPFESAINKEIDATWYIGTSISEKIECERLYVKPKGRYIKYIHKGEYSSEKIYKDAKEYAEEHELTIHGDVCESEIFPYIVSDKNNYMTEIYIPVK